MLVDADGLPASQVRSRFNQARAEFVHGGRERWRLTASDPVSGMYAVSRPLHPITLHGCACGMWLRRPRLHECEAT